jgi:hypothetical protein
VESAHYQLVDLEAPNTRAPYCEPANRQRTERERTQRERAKGERAGSEGMLLRDSEAHATQQAGYVPFGPNRTRTPNSKKQMGNKPNPSGNTRNTDAA